MWGRRIAPELDAASGTLKAADSYTEKKRNHQSTDRLCEEAGIDYQPLVFESFGGLCDEGRECIRSINRLVAQNTNTPNSEVARQFWQKISVEIQKANHRAFVKRTANKNFYVEESASNRFLRRVNRDDGEE